MNVRVAAQAQPHLGRRILCMCRSEKKTPTIDKFSPTRGLNDQQHNAWEIAQLAIMSFDGSQPRGSSQNIALWRWQDLVSSFNGRPFRQVQENEIDSMQDIFSQVFFLGQLPPRTLNVDWRPLDGSRRAVSLTSASPGVPSQIYLNSAKVEVKFSILPVAFLMLHEMAHAFLDRYSSRDQRSWELATAGKSFLFTNLGITGHGRAWQLLVKAMEDHLGLVLGITGRLGREEGLIIELEAGGCVPCAHEVELLYPTFNRYSWFQNAMRAKDDTDLQWSEVRRMAGLKRLGVILCTNGCCRRRRRRSMP